MPRGVRRNKVIDGKTRERIQTSQIINRLQGHILGKIELAPTQVQAALGLLKKTLPDLQATEHSGDVTLNHERALAELA